MKIVQFQCSDKLGLSLELGSFAAGVMISTTDLSQHTLEQVCYFVFHVANFGNTMTLILNSFHIVLAFFIAIKSTCGDVCYYDTDLLLFFSLRSWCLFTLIN